MKEENIGVLSAGERFGFKGFEWIVLDNNVDGGVLAIMASAWNNEEYSGVVHCSNECKHSCQNHGSQCLRYHAVLSASETVSDD